ncbi:hypothetical protein [Streptomyces sp. 4F14]|uniref:hypothetical protein n=1 Tax=Streptomyces sp. 4F14 TaxID=3394380 RepID=UPI003A8B66BC
MGGVLDDTVRQALGHVESQARACSPTHPRIPRRTRLCQQDDALLLITDGRFYTFLTRFSLAELVEDSAEK